MARKKSAGYYFAWRRRSCWRSSSKRGYRPSPPRERYPDCIARLFRLGMPNILMQSAYTFYILGLNLILATFCDQAVTALGLYYKWQTFFFIPLGAMQTCIVPVISYNYAARKIDRCRKTLRTAVCFGLALMAAGMLCFLLFPSQMLRVFTADPLVIQIGRIGFRFVGISFLPLVTSLIFPVFFQAVGSSLKSSALTVIRTVVLFVPLGFLFSRLGLNWFWLTFPVTETLTSLVGLVFYRRFLAQDYVSEAKRNIRRSDRARASYYRHISGRRWGDARHYELLVDSSVGVEKTADIILQYVAGHGKA